jgi:lauroyl/myristoyl acyltransferase
VLVGLGVRLPGGRFQGFVSGPVEFERTSDAAQDDIANTQRVVKVLEGYIRRYPGQWLAFSPLWPGPDKTATVTMNNTEVAV